MTAIPSQTPPLGDDAAGVETNPRLRWVLTSMTPISACPSRLLPRDHAARTSPATGPSKRAPPDAELPDESVSFGDTIAQLYRRGGGLTLKTTRPFSRPGRVSTR